MPRRAILSAAERDSLLTLPESKDELIRLYTFSETDLAIIRRHRGSTNRLGFAIQLCYMRHPGVMLEPNTEPFAPLLRMVTAQLEVQGGNWAAYGQRAETRREHLLEIQSVFGFRPFSVRHYQPSILGLKELAWQTDKGIVLASAMIDTLRGQKVLLPSLNVIERVCAEAITRANRRIHAALNDALSKVHHERLDQLLTRKEDGKITWLAWLRQSPAKPNSRSMLEHIERLKALQALELPANLERLVHQNRLLKIAREGAPMTPADLGVCRR